MRTKLIALTIFALLNIVAIVAKGGEEVKGPPKSWWTDWSVSPQAVLRTANVTGASDFGGGVDIGYNLNNTVSLHIQNTAYETDDWRGSVVDETSLLCRADFIRDSHERFVVYGLGGFDWDWERDAWGLGVGLGIGIRLSKNVEIGPSYRVRFHEDGDKDGLATAALSLRF